MFQQILISLALKALQAALCQFFQICINHDECPDGVCDDGVQAVQSLSDETPDPTSALPQAVKFDLQWDQLECLVTSVKELVKCIRKFLGLDRAVG